MSITVTGIIRADLRGITDEQALHVVRHIVTTAPAGARVEFVVGKGQACLLTGLDRIRGDGRPLDVAVVGFDVSTVGSWVRALRGEG